MNSRCIQIILIDIGEGAIVRYIEDTGEVVGLTLIGLKERLLESLKTN